MVVIFMCGSTRKKQTWLGHLRRALLATLIKPHQSQSSNVNRKRYGNSSLDPTAQVS